MSATPASLQSEFLDCSANDAHVEALNVRLAQVFDLREHENEERGEIESFIRQCFAAAHGARINQFMPRLLSLRAKRGDLIAAFGLRSAADSRLFLETYLDRPIEAVLQARLGQAVNREEVIEVGNLSVLYPGAARWLIVALTAMLHEEGYKWVVFTGTASLRNGFSRLGLRPVELGAATLEHLSPSDRADWGHYYDHTPLVMAGDIAYGYRSLLMQRDLAELLRTGMDSVETA
ncbi:MAG TPA: thermostable hemolysin [Methylophilaceae bacterium]|nr:thermostable hemolysin [Methylophilaceae bacterium]HQR60225.1 thermostable hemolysin [Methylophilaceae bacterium]